MGEKGYESRFVCKLCNKKFPCGKSLGGHMRSHVVANSAEFQDKDEFNLKKASYFLDDDETKLGESGNGQTGYGLRENPKKTWRAADSRLPLPPDQVCKQCGKGFQSLKALCGHMACHSDKDKGMKDDDSWSNEENDEKMVFDTQSDTESEELKLRSRSSSKGKKYKKIADESPFSVANHASSSVSEIDFVQDPKDAAAMCLWMMSRDIYGIDSVVESSDNNSVVMETTKPLNTEKIVGRKECRMPKEGTIMDAENEKMESSDSGYYLDECDDEVRKSLKMIDRSRNEYDDDGTESRKRKYDHEYVNESARMMKNGNPKVSQKKSKYECFNCKKVFKSYQALGGHRPCHKRMNESNRDESDENNPDDSSTYHKKPSAKSSLRNTEKNNSSKKNKEQVCPFCNRVFKNGQALGGHKRSHFIGGHDDGNSNRSPVVEPELPDLLDLNLPAPEANEDD